MRSIGDKREGDGGREAETAAQEQIWIKPERLAKGPGHPFITKVNDFGGRGGGGVGSEV